VSLSFPHILEITNIGSKNRGRVILRRDKKPLPGVPRVSSERVCTKTHGFPGLGSKDLSNAKDDKTNRDAMVNRHLCFHEALVESSSPFGGEIPHGMVAGHCLAPFGLWSFGLGSLPASMLLGCWPLSCSFWPCPQVSHSVRRVFGIPGSHNI
jgi:hypothetical protein